MFGMSRLRLAQKLPAPPACDIQGRTAGNTLLITAGMDGDEYAGIEAAHLLIEKYRSGNFNGRLVVVPIINLAGFENKSSHNPTDGKLPKNIFPGRARGSASEQLVHWLVATHVSAADAWLDLHGGALTESLTPFLWTYQTGVKSVDARTEKFYKASGAEIVLLQKAGMFTKARALAKRKRPCTYVMAESGERGERKQEDIERHIHWAEVLMRQLGMLPATDHTQQPNELPGESLRELPKKAQLVLRNIQYGYTSERMAHDSLRGIILWHKEKSERKDDILYGIGY
ncbi:MAG: succinylglutamate desuccinylase/aspartoacylase family protein [bacterium]